MGGKLYIENGVLTKYNGSGGDVVIPEGVIRIASKAFSKEEYRHKVNQTNQLLHQGLQKYSVLLIKSTSPMIYPSLQPVIQKSLLNE